MRRIDWRKRAECLTHVDLFMEQTCLSASEGTPKPAVTLVSKAKRVCFSCPVRDTCLKEALQDEAYLGAQERYGIRGGLTARERLLIALLDPMCARCQKNVLPPNAEPHKRKTVCRSCSLELFNQPSEKYFGKVSEMS